MTFFIINLIFILIILIYLYKFYYKYIEYYEQIKNKSKIRDFTRWILTDKYVGKQYAKINGFNIPRTYQIVKYPHHIKFLKNCVIKPLDLCDSSGVYLIKNNINLKNNKIIDKKIIVKELHKLRSSIFDEYYMYQDMFNGLVPFSGYIIEELLLDNGNIPNDYKCYVFNGKVFFIAMTYNRKKNIKGNQTFDSLWFDRNWKPIYFKMIKKGYKYNNNIKKPKGFDNMIKLVENISKKLKRHCRIDVYLINGKVYFGEFTFFCGAKLHTFLCNLYLGIIWNYYPDNYNYEDPNLKKLIPKFYNKPY